MSSCPFVLHPPILPHGSTPGVGGAAKATDGTVTNAKVIIEPNDLGINFIYLIKNNELRKSMGMKGRLRFERNFTLQKFENRMNIILLKCCK